LFRLTLLQKAKFSLGAVMIFVYLGLAVIFAFTDYLNNILFSDRRIIFAGVLAFYGCFKMYVLFRNYKRLKFEDHNEN